MEISVSLGWDVQRPIRGPNVADGNYDHIHQGPDSEATETEELSNALLPVTQVEPEKLCWLCDISACALTVQTERKTT